MFKRWMAGASGRGQGVRAMWFVATLLPMGASAAAFQADSVVVLRVGDGVVSLASGNAVPTYLDEYSWSGVLRQSVLLPLTESGNSLREGQLSLSADGRALVVPGYGAAVGATTAGSTAVPRQVALVDAAGLSATLPVSALNSRVYSATATSTGSGAYLSGSAGVAHVNPFGVSTKLSTTRANDLAVAGGQLFMSTDGGTAAASAAGIYAVGNGLPTSGAPALSLVAALSDPYGISLLDLNDQVAGVDTLYALSLTGGADANGVGYTGLYKFSKQLSGAWTLTGHLAVDLRSLESREEAGGVRLVGADGAGRHVLGWMDTGGWGALGAGGFATIATVATRTSFLGASMAPSAVPEPAAWALALAGVVCSLRFSRRQPAPG